MIPVSEYHGTHDHILIYDDTGNIRTITYFPLGSLDHADVGSGTNVLQVNISVDCSSKRRNTAQIFVVRRFREQD